MWYTLKVEIKIKEEKMTKLREDIRNVAIIAHVDHGKTTLVDELLKQSHTLDERKELDERAMDSNDLEKERGITILAKNTAVAYNGTRINIMDTPGHADFGGEVERIMKMVDGVVLVVDAYEGTMPQTRFVLKKALEQNLTPIVVVNKIDKPSARPEEVVDEVLELFIELGADDDQLEFPVVYASAINGTSSLSDNPADQEHTMAPIFDTIIDHIPAPVDNSDEPLQFQVSLLDYNDFVGRIGIGRIFRGTVKVGDQVTLSKLDGTTKNFRVTKLFGFFGLERREIEEAKAGDIVVVTKVGDLKTGDTIAAKPDAVPLDPIELPKPQIYYAIVPKNKGDEEKIASCLNKVSEEDPTIHWYRNPETKQTLVGGQGELHINTIKKQMKEKYGVDFDLEDIKVAYRETIKGSSDVQGKHKKQSGGRGQYGDVKIRFSRSTEDFDFSEEIFGGSVPKSYIPAVEKGLRDSMQKGILAGYPVTNIKAVLYDGSYHDVDSSEMAFKTAASIAFKKGMQEAKPILLEPIMKLKITVPEEYMGDVMGDINKRRGKILGMEPDDKGKQVIFAEAPQSETFKYAIDLRAMTQGRGQFEMEIEKYEEVPGQIAKKIIEEAQNN